MIETLVHDGLAALNGGDLATAARLFEQAAQAAPGWPVAAWGMGMARFHGGDYAGAVEPLSRAVEGGVNLPGSWRFLCFALGMAGRDGDLAAALARPEPPAAKAELVFQILSNRLALNDPEGVLSLAEALGDDDALAMPAAFWAGVALAERDGDASTRRFKQALDLCRRLRADGHTAEFMNTHVASGASMEDNSFVLADGPAPALDFAVEMLCDAPAADPSQGVVFAACDGGYFEAFASDCAASLASLGPGRTLHVHVVDPRPASFALMETLRAANPGLAVRFSIENTGGRGDAVYYACARFLRLETLFQRYGTDLLVSDIDGLFLPPTSSLPQAGQGADLAFFHVDTPFPWLRCHAALILWRNTSGGRRAATLLGCTLRRKLAEPRNWTLDQAALFCVLRALRAEAVAVADLRAALGVPMDKAIASQGSFAQKRAMRIAASKA